MAVETREYRAEAKFPRVSPQKARLVLDLIKGRGVEEALTTVAFTKKRVAPVIYQLLTSAVDNAKYVAGEQGNELDVDRLYVKTALANDGPRMKRIRPAPMGRAYRYQRRLTHIVLAVAEREADHGMVTKVEEPEATHKTARAKAGAPKTAPRAAKAKAAEPKAAHKASKAKAEEHKTTKAKAEVSKATTKKAEKSKAAGKSTKKKAGKKA
jgi:large subunit ribosomal protein L22